MLHWETWILSSTNARSGRLSKAPIKFKPLFSEISVGCKRGRLEKHSDSSSMPNSSCRQGDQFSFQELAHLPIISSDANVHSNLLMSPASPRLFSLVTPEKRIELEARCYSSISKGSSNYATFMFPSPSKLVFSPTGEAFSHSSERFLKNECKL